MRADTARGDPTALGLMTEMLTFKFAGTMMFMSDIFPMLDKFSRLTQGRGPDVDLGVFFDELPKLIVRLEYMADHADEVDADNGHFTTLEEKLKLWTKSTEEGGAGLDIKKGGMGARGEPGGVPHRTTKAVLPASRRSPALSIPRA